MRSLKVRLVAAAIVAVATFAIYNATLLPGQDLGDTASFQAIAGEPVLTARQGYPLYFAIAGLFVHALPGEAARAVNLASAVEAALAAGLLVLVGAELGGSLVAGLVAAVLLAGSYTCWSQAIIAEVYALHLLVTSLCLLTLLAWYRRPSLPRLALFFAVFAVGFGNHLSMVLLLPGFALFLLLAAPEGPGSMFRPATVLLALVLAVAGALQYWWNMSALLADRPDMPWLDVIRTFWFDVTKADWRANMVFTISWSTLSDRFAAYWFDLRQQVGVIGALLAAIGIVRLFATRWKLGLLLLSLWLVNWAFAFTYNVGDVHVFYLPSHLFVALAAGCAAGWAFTAVDDLRPAHGHHLRPALVALALLAYPLWRVYDTYPAMDRSADRADQQFFDGLTAGMDGSREILGADLNWQLHNGLDYYEKYTRPGITVFDVPERLLYFPLMAWDNFAMGRSIVLTQGSADMVRAAYGDLIDVEPDPRVHAAPLAERVSGLAPGTPFVLALLEPYSDTPLDSADLAATIRRLGLAPGDLPSSRYSVVVGRVGRGRVDGRSSNEPFRLRTDLAGHAIEVRMECWLPADTIRRMGFGHVIVDRQHVLTIDRGVSFVALTPDGSAQRTAWAAGILAPQPRFLVRAPRQADPR